MYTDKTLRKCGYTGRIVYVVDNEDDQYEDYCRNFGKDNVYLFDKKAVAEWTDEGLPGDRRTITYARNVSPIAAKELGYKYFIQLDDDYIHFGWRFNNKAQYLCGNPAIKNLDNVFDIMIDFYIRSGIKSVSMSQGGDFIGGHNSGVAKKVYMKRKAMNSFICDVDKPIRFLGRLNEDVNTYTKLGSMGDVFMQTNMVSLRQKQTQGTAGGITEVYKANGALNKPFMTVMYMPSCVKISLMGNHEETKRLHHFIKWECCVPRIINEKYKKK
jgi:hypothetical protein